MKYYVKIKVHGRYNVEIEADSVEEAKSAAEYKFGEADFGENLEDIDGDVIVIEDENGNYVYER